MKRHLYRLMTPCYSSKNNIVMTDEIKEHVLKHRRYDLDTTVRAVVSDKVVSNSLVSRAQRNTTNLENLAGSNCTYATETFNVHNTSENKIVSFNAPNTHISHMVSGPDSVVVTTDPQ